MNLKITKDRKSLLYLLAIGNTVAFATWQVMLNNYTVVMSIGFHYLETLHNSLSLQWLSKAEAPKILGKLLSVKAFSNIAVLGAIYFYLMYFPANYNLIYMLAGGITVAIAIYCWAAIPHFEEKVPQRKELFLRKQYWLYYALTFLAGARRQIFVVFAGFLLVEKFGFPIENVVLMTLVNSAMTFWLAPKIGVLISIIGERKALTLEYIGLIIVFISYAFVDSVAVAIVLYLLDHLFFAMAIAIKTYFQKIADPADIAATSSISFTINHIAAVVLPALLGLVWMINHSAVFIIGAGIACLSLGLSQLIPDKPMMGKETRLPPKLAAQAPL